MVGEGGAPDVDVALTVRARWCADPREPRERGHAESREPLDRRWALARARA
ncbi:MAG: hypothetical protein ACLU37_00795 [Collinsella sp.]